MARGLPRLLDLDHRVALTGALQPLGGALFAVRLVERVLLVAQAVEHGSAFGAGFVEARVDGEPRHAFTLA